MLSYKGSAECNLSQQLIPSVTVQYRCTSHSTHFIQITLPQPPMHVPRHLWILTSMHGGEWVHNFCRIPDTGSILDLQSICLSACWVWMQHMNWLAIYPRSKINVKSFNSTLQLTPSPSRANICASSWKNSLEEYIWSVGLYRPIKTNTMTHSPGILVYQLSKLQI